MHGFVYDVRLTRAVSVLTSQIRDGTLKDLGVSVGPNGPVKSSVGNTPISPEVVAAVERRFVHSYDRRRSRVHTTRSRR